MSGKLPSQKIRCAGNATQIKATHSRFSNIHYRYIMPHQSLWPMAGISMRHPLEGLDDVVALSHDTRATVDDAVLEAALLDIRGGVVVSSAGLEPELRDIKLLSLFKEAAGDLRQT